MAKKRLLIAILMIILTFFAFYYSHYTIEKFTQTMQLIVNIIIPSLTPFMILIQFLILYNGIDVLGFLLQYISYPIFKISGYGAIIVLTSIFGGFPYSAIMANELLKENKIEKQEAQRIVKYIFFPSLAFMLSTLLNINFVYQKEFQLITFCVYFAGFLLLFLTRKSGNRKKYISKNEFSEKLTKQQKKDITQVFMNVSFAVVKSLISICFSILIFSMLKYYISLLFKGKAINLVSGIFEFSGTSIAILIQPKLFLIDYIILTFILSFSGFSVFFQAMPFLKDTELTLKNIIGSRLLTAFVSVCLFLIFYILIF